MSQAASLCLGHRSQNCPIVDRKCCQRVELSPFTKRMNRNVYISIWETRSSRSQTAGNWQLFSRHSPLARRGPPSLPRAAPGTEVPPPQQGSTCYKMLRFSNFSKIRKRWFRRKVLSQNTFCYSSLNRHGLHLRRNILTSHELRHNQLRSLFSEKPQFRRFWGPFTSNLPTYQR